MWGSERAARAHATDARRCLPPPLLLLPTFARSTAPPPAAAPDAGPRAHSESPRDGRPLLPPTAVAQQFDVVDALWRGCGRGPLCVGVGTALTLTRPPLSIERADADADATTTHASGSGTRAAPLVPSSPPPFFFSFPYFLPRRRPPSFVLLFLPLRLSGGAGGGCPLAKLFFYPAEEVYIARNRYS